MDNAQDTPDDVDEIANAQYNTIDWESVETHYRAGQVSIR